MNVSAMTQGSSPKVRWAGNQRATAANSSRPAVAAAQNIVSVTAARPAPACKTPFM